ncbi:MAG: Coenzyme F420 hydrogenase/dehydrogenase, beta subunit C-terminal domain [Ilumatobacteraceae bacterium]
MSTTENLAGVIDSGMCIGCGACEMADGSVRVELDPRRRIYQPTSAGSSEAAAVCPAVAVDYAGLHEWLYPGADVGPYGVVRSVHLSQSTDLDRNLRASSGGLVKEVLRSLLSSGDIDGVIALGHVQGLEFAARLVTSADAVDDLPGSIYHNLHQVSALQLLRDTPGRLVVVGIPCQLEGLWSWVRRRAPELRDRVTLTIGLLCGWQYSHHSIHAIGQYLGFDPAHIDDISYRGGGPVGQLTVRTTDGSEYTASRRIDFGYQVAFDRHFNTNRCHVCINHSNFLADLVVGDAWLPSTVFTKTGISLVICRTERAEQVLAGLVSSGSCNSVEVSVDEIRESQTDRVVFGEFAYAYADYLRSLGGHVPDLRGPNESHGTRKPRRQVAKFHRELVRKQALMANERYRYLKFRKATLEIRSYVMRYVRWFVVRILRVKSLSGQRREIPRERLSSFR